MSDADGKNSQRGTCMDLRFAIVGAVLSVGLFVLGRYTAGVKRRSAKARRLQLDLPAKSIAVLPFENLSEEKANQFSPRAPGSDSDEIGDRAGSKVISRTSTAKYQSKPDNLKRIAKSSAFPPSSRVPCKKVTTKFE